METQMSTAIRSRYPWTVKDMAAELGMSVQYFRIWKSKMEKDGKIAKPAIGSLFCVRDAGPKLKYSDAYVEKIKELRPKTVQQDLSERKTANAKLHIPVRIFDEQIAKFLMERFKTNAAMEEFLREQLTELVKPVLLKAEQLKRQYESDMEALMKGIRSN